MAGSRIDWPVGAWHLAIGYYWLVKTHSTIRRPRNLLQVEKEETLSLDSWDAEVRPDTTTVLFLPQERNLYRSMSQ